MTDLIRVSSAIAGIMAAPAFDKVRHAQRFISVVQKIGFSPNPPQDFEGCYVHTLVEYGLLARDQYGQTRCKPLIEFFGHEDIRQAFSEWFNDPNQERATFARAAEKLAYWNKIGDDLRDVHLDPRQEFQTFADLFNKHVDRTRSAFQTRLEGKVDVLLEDLEDVPTKIVEEIKKEVMTVLRQEQVVISDDGLPISDQDRLAPPLSQFSPHFIDGLFEPSGPVKLRDKFYIEREADRLLKKQVIALGSMTTIRAPRQTGKSSLLIRGLHYARQNGLNVVRIDLQGLDPNNMQSRETFLHYLARFMVRKLRLDRNKVIQAWQSGWAPQDKLTFFMEDYILPESGKRLVLMIDEADRLLETDFHSDFFALMRSWHHETVAEEVWKKLNICLVISSEPHLFISDLTQSPFNVGQPLYLKDFTRDQVRDLNQRHHSPLSEKDLRALMELLNGHPYLTRRALYTIVTNNLSWRELKRLAVANNGPFADHLNYHYRVLHDKSDLRDALSQIMRGHQPDETILYRLLRAGLVKSSDDAYTLRCDLYRIFFENKL